MDHDMNLGIFKSVSVTASCQNSREIREMQKNGAATLRVENDKVRTLGFSAESVVETAEIWTGIIGFEVYNDLVNSTRTDISAGNAVGKTGIIS